MLMEPCCANARGCRLAISSVRTPGKTGCVQLACLDLLLRPGSRLTKLPPLMRAVANADMPAMKALLKDGASIDEQDCEGNVALSYAAMGGSIAALEELLQAPGGGKCLNHRNSNKSAPLLLAAEAGHLPALQKLLKVGAAPLDADADGCSALTMVCKTLWEGSEDFSVDAAKALLDQGAEINHITRSGATPLYLAAEYGLVRTVSALHEREADAKVPCGPYCFTPLLVAAANGRACVVEELMKELKVADVEACDSAGNTALALAVLFGKREYNRVVKLLLAGVFDYNKHNKFFKTALMIAAEMDDTTAVEELLQYNCNPEVKDIRGFTALHYAAMQSNLDVVMQLLAVGANAFEKGRGGRLPVDVVGLPLFDRELKSYGKDASLRVAGIEGLALVEEAKRMSSYAAFVEARRVGKVLRNYMFTAELVKTEGLRSILNGISIVAVLIVTVTFLGLQTPPGGPSDGDGGLLKLAQDSYMGVHAQSGHAVLVNHAALRLYFILDGLSLFLAASNLLLVLTFLLPGVATLFRKLDQAAWVWCMLVSCTVLLAMALLCAVGAYSAAGFAVIPAEEYVIMKYILGVGGPVLLLTAVLLLSFIVSVVPFNTGTFILRTLPKALCGKQAWYEEHREAVGNAGKMYTFVPS